RAAVIARELTKLHEEFARGSLSELTERFSKSEAARGEMVLIVSGHQVDSPSSSRITSAEEKLGERIDELAREGLDQKTALKQAAKELGLKRDDAYRMMVNQKNRRTR